MTTLTPRDRRWILPRVLRLLGPLAGVVLVLASIATASAVAVGTSSAALLGGGADIRSAPLIAPGQRVEGNLGAVASNYYTYYKAEFFKVNFRVGDRVQLRAESAGDYVPCADFYKPGTDDFNLDSQRRVEDVRYTQTNPKRSLFYFTAGTTATYVLAMNTRGGPCSSSAAQWAYAITILAPHALRLVLPRDKTVRNGQRFVVRALGALSVPVTQPKLTVRLFATWGTGKPRRLGQGSVRAGKVAFTLRLPASLKGKQVRLIASAGDNRTWVATRVGRSYIVR